MSNDNNSSTDQKNKHNYSYNYKYKSNYKKRNNKKNNYVRKKENSKVYTAEEMRKWYNTVKANNDKSMKLVNVEKTQTRTFSEFNKDTLRSYMKNPFQNQAKLRELSRFLYRRSQPYRRLVFYNASSFQANARRVTPLISLVEDNNKDDILRNYYDTLVALQNLNLENEILKMLIIAWREDLACGFVFSDETGTFILPLDNDYCQVSSVNFDGTLNFSYDFSYFNNKQDELEYMGDPFISMYNSYKSDSKLRWQEIPPEISFCIKINIDDWLFPIPPYVALFNSIIDLCDLENIQALKDEISIYKMLVARLETMNNSNIPDDWKVDIDTAIAYYNRISDQLPDWCGIALSPVPIESIDLHTDETSDVNKVSKATENLYNTSGGAQILNSSTISGTTAFTASIKADSEYSIAPVLPQIENWVNRRLLYSVGDKHAIVKFMRVTPYTKESFRKELLENGTYGLPNRLALNCLNGVSELETLSMKFLEQDCLNLHEDMIPMMSSHTQSGIPESTDGAPTKDDGELTDDGEASRDKRDNKN